MQTLFSKRNLVLIGIVAVIIIGVIFFFVFHSKAPVAEVVNIPVTTSPVHTVLGKSVQGRNIDLYSYGNGPTHLALVGGIHGGYEWNAVVLAYDVMDYLNANPDVVPKNLTVMLIPDANPDAVYKVVGKEGRFTSEDITKSFAETVPGRFNANNVDLNRNFDCKWQPESTWQNKKVSGGTEAFSEPESKVLKSFVEQNNPVAVVWWHSQSGAVYASQCGNGILPETLKIMNAYAEASGYKAVPTFDAYATSGDSEGWLAKIGIPAITVELTTHNDIEFDKNIAGVKALFEYYKK